MHIRRPKGVLSRYLDSLNRSGRRDFVVRVKYNRVNKKKENIYSYEEIKKQHGNFTNNNIVLILAVYIYNLCLSVRPSVCYLSL